MRACPKTEAALLSKINKTQALKALVEKELANTELELQSQLACQTKLQRLGASKASKLELSQARLKLKLDRPQKELANDDVQLQLVTQTRLLSNFVHKLERGRQATATDISRLAHCRDALRAEVAAKEEAIRIDRQALCSVPEDYGTSAGNLQRRALLPRHVWEKQAADVISSATTWRADATALRRMLARTVQENTAAERHLEAVLEEAMSAKINWSRKSCEELEQQLAEVKEEIAAAKSRKAEALEIAKAHMRPTALAKHRYMLRKARPQQEQVLDEAEDALLDELRVLRGQNMALERQAAVIDRQLERLHARMLQIEVTLRAKRQEESVDVQCAMLDGRPSVARPSTSASSSVWSFSSVQRPVTAGKPLQPVAAMDRLDLLERELERAREERTQLERSVAALQAELAYSVSEQG